MVGAGAGAGSEIFEKLEPEPHKNGPAPQHLLTDDKHRTNSCTNIV
jgi:hypothetical protein